MSILIMKFGGASLGSSFLIKNAASIIKKKREQFKKIVVIASAMGDMTNNLLKLSKKISSNCPKRETDMLITAGERISIALLAMALFDIEIDAVSFTGSQSGIITTNDHLDAKIIDIKPYRVLKSLEEGKIVIIAGFQGVSNQKEITTLGRGGSDTSAVFLASFLDAKKVEFYKDVGGVYSKDPKENKDAKMYKNISYKKAFALAKKGACFLHPRSIKLATEKNICLHILPYENRGNNRGTLIKNI